MAHFARVEDGTVHEVIVVSNEVLRTDPHDSDSELAFPESESLGQVFIAGLPELGESPGEWLQCSYNGNFRGVFPGSGYIYDARLDEFVPPSWQRSA